MFYRDTYANIDCDAIAFNLQQIQTLTSQSLIAVLKANAYGHCDYWTAKTAIEQGCIMVAVSSLDEALSLRYQGFTEDILILGHIRPSDIDRAIANHFIVTVISADWIKTVAEMNQNFKGLRFHIKVDSGMNRIGMKSVDEVNTAVELIHDHHGIAEGIFTHYACADSFDKTMCQNQVHFFQDIVKNCSHVFKWIHCENSAAILDFQDSFTNACRCGLIMYGISPLPCSLNLKPAFSLYTHMICVKKIHKGESVGYGATFIADEDCYIATLPIGYADGFIRANQGRKLYCEGEWLEIVGRVCMDQCMVRLPYEMPLGSRVEIVSENLPLCVMANELNMIPYEVLCLFSDRIPRIIYRNCQKVAVINHRIHE